MKNDGEAGKSLADFFKNIETKLGLLTGLELISAVACADSDCKRVNACSLNEILNLFGLCVALVAFFNNNVILNAGKCAELALNNYAVSVSILNNLLCNGNVLLIGERRTVNHNRSETAVNALLAGFKIGAVVKVESDGNICISAGCFYHLCDVGKAGIVSCAL